MPPLKEAESKIASETKIYNVALESTAAAEFAKTAGVIISLFALVEGDPPLVLDKLGVISKEDARSILGVFRAFSNRIDLLKQVSLNRPEASAERVCLSYYKGLFNEANIIRNKYAHATYSIGRFPNGEWNMHLQIFSGDHNRKVERQIHSVTDFKADADRLKRIISELHALCYRDEVPSGLHKQLQKLSP